MKHTIIMIVLLAMLCSLGAITTTEVHGKLQGAYKNIQSYQATVVQTNYYPQLKKSITYTGKMYFSGGRMLMHFTKPSLQRMHIENNMLTVYEELSNTIFTSEIQPQYGRMNPLEILQLYWDRSQVKITAERKTEVDITLTPQKDPTMVSLGATINTKSGHILKLSYKDTAANSVSYSFSDIKTNAAIPASVWNFSYPKDAQRINQ